MTEENNNQTELKDINEIKKIIEEFFAKTTIGVNIEFENPKQSFSLEKEYENQEAIFVLPVLIETQDAQILIGEKGQTLFEIQHLLKLILRKKFNQFILVDLDVNNYKKKKIEYLEEVAEKIADEVVSSKKEKFLPPMLPYERRMVHLKLSQRKDIVSESVGLGRDRKIIIKPV